MSGKTVVTVPIDTSDPSDTYPTHYANKGLGGFKNLSSAAERDALATIEENGRINDGTVVFIKDYSNDNNPHGYISIYQQGNSSPNDWKNYPIRKVQYIESPTGDDFKSGKKTDQIITNDYIYICTESADLELNNNIAVWKKVILSI